MNATCVLNFLSKHGLFLIWKALIDQGFPFLYILEDVKKSVLDEQRKYIFKSVTSRHILNREGHLVKIIHPLDLHDPQQNKESLRDHMLFYVTGQREINLLLHGDIQEYLKNVTKYHLFEN